MRNGETLIFGGTGLGGERGSLFGLIFPLTSSGQTWETSTNELTWSLRHVSITAVANGVSSSGRLSITYSLNDQLDLRPNKVVPVMI